MWSAAGHRPAARWPATANTSTARTHGMIGSLSHLVRGAAIDAILDNTEKITKAHLTAIQLDHATETTPVGQNGPTGAA